jgi:hypothetical protein
MDRVVDREARAGEVILGRVQVRLVVRRRLPRPVEVVALSRSEIERGKDLADLEAGVDFRRRRRQGRRQQVVLAVALTVRVELLPKLLDELGEVLLVLGPDDVAHVSFRARPLPVEIDAVEDTRSGARAAHPAPTRIGANCP